MLLEQKEPTAVFFWLLLSFALRRRMLAAATGGFTGAGDCRDRAILGRVGVERAGERFAVTVFGLQRAVFS